MIPVVLGGTTIEVKPKRLLNYVEKLEHIKSRRTRPWDLISGFPKEMTEENYKVLVGLAMKQVYCNSSAVSIEEELQYDRSLEGFFFDVWRCGKLKKKTNKGPREETWEEGIQRVKDLWDRATPEEQSHLKMALFATDEGNTLGNSNGPSEQSQTLGPQKPQPSP
jgi:hypothetical protein